MLASHKWARESYTIILAMEARELESREGRDKLDSLLHEYGSGGHFKKVHCSTHELTAGEVASKCSNVSAAVRHAVAKLEPGLETKTVATVMDADSLLLEDYVERAAGVVMSAPESRPAMAWPPMAFQPLRLWLFGGDARLGNWVAGCFDSVWQIIVYSGAGRPTPVKMPVAVYSLRLDVLLDAGIDTTPEGVGEDMMMAMRAYTARGAHSVFVPVPFGSQRCKELKTRLRQTLRHAYGTVSLRYAAHSVICRPGLGAIILLGQALEVSGFFAVMLWLATKGQAVFSQSTLLEQLLIIGAGLSSGGISFFIQMRGFQVTKRDGSTPPVHSSTIAELGHSLCFIASFAIAAQVYAILNLLAIVLMAIYGPAAVTHRPNTAA
ncbi:hypothetical protein AB1Y20_002411 [Prymnesium parvum]|uniref:Glycosyltransferase 2-like domain-containing protein n=1 Tax=Prymnesium parvum TaxID=97485 RepID=A0AB34JAK2_PRYPA